MSGKYSLDCFLNVISDYADKEILKELQGRVRYKSGKCIVFRKNEEEFQFQIELLFEDDLNHVIIRKLEKDIPISKFVRETSKKINHEPIVFYIQRPEVE